MDFFNNLRNLFSNAAGGVGQAVGGLFSGGGVPNAYAAPSPTPSGNTGPAGPTPYQPVDIKNTPFYVPQSSTPPSGGGGSNGQQSQQQPQGQQQQQQQQQPGGPSQDALGAIDSLYNQTISTLGGIQSNLEGEKSSEIGQLQQGQQRTQSQFKQAQGDRQAGIETRRGQARGQETSQLEQLRQLYGGLQAQQTAQLSAAGISSSSAAEALGAYLSRDQAQRIGSVIQTTGDTMGALDDEAKSVNDWFTQSTTELQQDTQGKIDQINRDFAGRVSQLDQIRGQSAVARQQQRGELFNQYQQQLSDLNNYAQQAAYSLQLWQDQQKANLATARQSLGNITEPQAVNFTNPQGQVINLGYEIPKVPGGQFVSAFDRNDPRLAGQPFAGLQTSSVSGPNNSARFYQPR